MAEWIAAEVFPPGEFIRDELEARGWKQDDLAVILNRPPKLVNGIIAGKKRITPETALGLAEAFGTSAEFWVNMEGAYRVGLLRKKEAAEGKKKGEVAKRRALAECAPFREMMKRHWIPTANDADEIESHLNRFFGRKVLEQEIEFAFAAKKSGTYTAHTPAQKAWIFQARKLAEYVGAERYEKEKFINGLSDLHKLLNHDAAARNVPALLAKMGVRFVVVEKTQGSHVDGAAFWMNGSPVIAVSFRYDRIDNFWFTVAHECAHVYHEDDGSCDEYLVGENATATEEKPEFEKRADLWARNYLIADNEIENFILRMRPFYSKIRINQFANRIQVHPGVIVGQLQRRREVDYCHNREMLVKVKDIVSESAMCDGWGDAPIAGKQ